MKNVLCSHHRSLTLVLLIAAMPSLTASRVFGLDALSLDPAVVESALAPPTQFVQGVPGTPNAVDDPGGSTIVLSYNAASPDPEPIPSENTPTVTGITSVFAGDIVFLADPNGGVDPSNWAAVLRFLNPNDPTGSLGLAATDEEAFFADNVGPGGFAGFSLFPNAVTAYNSTPDEPVNNYLGFLTEFGPEGAISASQTADFIYGVKDAVPEPGTRALLALGMIGLTISTRTRRFVSFRMKEAQGRLA